MQAVRLRKYPRDARRLIVFLTPGADDVTGGILSICAHYGESVGLRPIHNSEVLLCTVPGEPILARYTKFENSNRIFLLSQVLSYFKQVESLTIHIPEYHINEFLAGLSRREYAALRRVKELHLNIMLQNIRYIDGQNIGALKALGRTTCTTAHERYSTREIRDRLGVPLHRLSVYVSPEQYCRAPYEDKEDLLIVSPDEHPLKKAILEEIAAKLPHLRIQIISGLTYEQYKRTICAAKWSLTFGEGLDGYFVEAVFSGAVSLAAYNEEFFTPDFKSLETVYDSYRSLKEHVVSDLRRLDEKQAYAGYQAREFSMVAKYYNITLYRSNLARFYRGDYTFP